MAYSFQPSDTSGIFLNRSNSPSTLNELQESIAHLRALNGSVTTGDVASLSAIAEYTAGESLQATYTADVVALWQLWGLEPHLELPYPSSIDEGDDPIGGPEQASDEQLSVDTLIDPTFRPWSDEPWHPLTDQNEPMRNIQRAAATRPWALDTHPVERNVGAPAQSGSNPNDVATPESLSLSLSSHVTTDTTASTFLSATNHLRPQQDHSFHQGTPDPDKQPPIAIPRSQPSSNTSQTSSIAPSSHCPICNQSFSRSYDIPRHLASQHPPANKPYLLCAAAGCGQQWAIGREDRMRQHCREIHPHMTGQKFLEVEAGFERYEYGGLFLTPKPKRRRGPNSRRSSRYTG